MHVPRALDAVVDAPTRPLDADQTEALLVGLSRAASRLVQLQSRVIDDPTPAALCACTTPPVGDGHTTRDAQLICPRHHVTARRDPPMRT